MSPQSPFRQAALDRMASPEQLDQLIQVTRPRAWVALAALAVLVGAFAAWGVLGRLTTRVPGQGILLGGDVYDVMPEWPGRVTALHVGVGDQVTAGDLVAELQQPELAQRLENAQARARELEEELAYVVATGEREREILRTHAAQRRATLGKNIEEYQTVLGLLDAQLSGQRQLLSQGLVAAEQLIPSQQAYTATRAQLADARAALTQVTLDQLNAQFALQQREVARQQEVHEAERAVAELENEHALRSQIRCPYSGRVLEVAVDRGGVVSPGQSLLKLSLTGGDTGEVRAVLYVAGDDGKRVRPGMAVLVAPATIKPEEFGYLEGTVERIADFPATPEGMRRVLKNDELVRRLLAIGSPFEVQVAVARDAAAPSGYAWTSGRGPAITIGDGTPVRGLVVVEARRPVELVVPGIRKALALY
jgi:HlyD family secretion protein